MNPLYTLVMMLAVGAGIVLSRRTQQALTLTPGEKWAVGLGVFCGAMIGAKLPFVLADWEGMLSGMAWFSDGKTILCGLVGGYFGVEIAKWMVDIRIKTGDSFALPVAVSVGIGRVACFVGGCCYGTPTSAPWGVVFPAIDSQARHPTQLYEAAFHGLMAGVLVELQRRAVSRTADQGLHSGVPLLPFCDRIHSARAAAVARSDGISVGRSSADPGVRSPLVARQPSAFDVISRPARTLEHFPFECSGSARCAFQRK